MTQINTIGDRAMLVGLSISQFNPTKTDKKITAEVAQAHGSDESMGRYAKNVIAKEAVDALRKLAGEIRKEHGRRTLPWAEDGARILTNTGFDEYSNWMRGANAKWDAEVEKFLGSWDSFVADARLKLNGAFDAADYPSLEAVRAKFSFRWKVRPMPEAKDFRVNLGDEHVAAIRFAMEAESRAVVEQAMRSVWEQMRDVVKSMAERLKAYDPEKPAAHPFRDTLVTNIAELVDVLPALNLTNDPNVAKFTAEMQELTKHKAQDLRDHAWKRDDAATRAEAILNQMSQFIA